MPHENIPDWLVIVGVLALGAYALAAYVRYENRKEK